MWIPYYRCKVLPNIMPNFKKNGLKWHNWTANPDFKESLCVKCHLLRHHDFALRDIGKIKQNISLRIEHVYFHNSYIDILYCQHNFICIDTAAEDALGLKQATQVALWSRCFLFATNRSVNINTGSK